MKQESQTRNTNVYIPFRIIEQGEKLWSNQNSVKVKENYVG